MEYPAFFIRSPANLAYKASF